jgi:hypothetical protein
MTGKTLELAKRLIARLAHRRMKAARTLIEHQAAQHNLSPALQPWTISGHGAAAQAAGGIASHTDVVPTGRKKWATIRSTHGARRFCYGAAPPT